MKKLFSLLVLVCLDKALHAQYIYTIKADSVKITNSCDTAELIIENHTQNVSGFLFNKGSGRTEFRRVMQRLNDTLVVIGGDSLRLPYAWLQGGNRFGETGVFGTMDYYPVDFYSGGYKRARLTNNGSLQVGNSSSDNGEKLQVYGNIYSNGTRHLLGNLAITSGADVAGATSVGIRVDDIDYGSFILQSSTKGYLKDMFVFDAAITGLGKDVYTDDQSIIRIKTGIKSNNKPDNSLSVLNIQPEFKLESQSNPLTIRGIYYQPKLTNLLGSRHIAIETASGDVLLATTSGSAGIGTSMPTAQLHTTSTVRFAGLTNDNSLTRLLVSDANGNLYYRQASSLAFNETMNSDLAVNGRVSAQQMLITQTGRWPDYVFSKQYKLPSLAEVENFINQNNHLPGVPSAAEVEKKGVNVGDNAAAQLKKIEELTLYFIQQDKELKS
jgi:hypothetical protein